MVIDTSVFVAILRLEPEAQDLLHAIHGTSGKLVSAGSYLETSIVLLNRVGGAILDDLDALVGGAEIEVVPVSRTQVALARDAHRRFGKGNHPAGLTLGDCFAYALAKELDAPLLYTGDSFARTDIRPARRAR